MGRSVWLRRRGSGVGAHHGAPRPRPGVWPLFGCALLVAMCASPARAQSDSASAPWIDRLAPRIVAGALLRQVALDIDTVVDDDSREAVAIVAGHSWPGARMIQIREQLADSRGLHRSIGCDNGPECAGKALDLCAHLRGVASQFIRQGKPIENAFIESFNGRFRDECLNLHRFQSLTDAQQAIDAWRADCNTIRPHRSL